MLKSIIKNIIAIKKVDGYKVLILLGRKIYSPFNRYKIYNSVLSSYKRLRFQNIRNTRGAFTVSNILSDIISFQTLHKIKEKEHKEKVKEGKKIRVCFFLDEIAKWSSRSVYEAMLEHPQFEPFLVLYHAYDTMRADDRIWNEYSNQYHTLKEKGYNIYPGYDENRNFISLECYEPDIVFLSTPYLSDGPSLLSVEYMNVNYLVCYVSYGMNTINLYEYHYNNRHIYTVWKHFVETREDYEEIMAYSSSCGVNTVLTGYPKLDAYTKPIYRESIHEKINNGNPIVIYAPHWSIRLENEAHDLATFHLYSDYFLSLVKQYPHINFVFKPHPNLGRELVRKGIMTAEEYDVYIQEWDNQPNGLYLFDGDYIELFKLSSLLITDSGSFIGEWLPSGNPCLYLVNPRRNPKRYMEGFSFLGRRMLEQYYLCYTKEDIASYFHILMEEQRDEKKASRVQLQSEIFINIGCAGSKIVEYLHHYLSK